MDGAAETPAGQLAVLAVLAVLVVLAVLLVAAVARRGQKSRPRETVIPRRTDLCAGPAPDPDPELRAWGGQDNANGTVAVTPWDPDSRIQLTAGALTAGARPAHRPVNPVSRIGVNDSVPAWEGLPSAAGAPAAPRPGGPCDSTPSIYEIQPFQPGFLAPKADDSTDGTRMAGRYYYQPPYWSFAAGPAGGPYRPIASCGGAPAL